MDSIHFLNLEYFILLVYSVFVGASGHIELSRVPIQTVELMTKIAWTGLGLGVIFIIGIIYSYKRLGEVEHAGWTKRHEQEDSFKRHHAVETPRNAQWDRIVTLANSPQESDWRRAIIEADIMLGTMLETRGYRGGSIGDMLKTANPIQFTTLDLAWTAHKVRNDIAHGGENFLLTEREARATIDMYRRVFEEFDYI